jgi:hypothetical protein
MEAFDFLIYFTFFVKIIFITSTLYLKYLEHQHKTNQTLSYWKDRSEFIFKACLSVILIILFNPHRKTPPVINSETRLLLYLYGFIVILQANWKQFIKDSPLNHKKEASQS